MSTLDFVLGLINDDPVHERPSGFGVTLYEIRRAKGITEDKAKRHIERIEKTGVLVARRMRGELGGRGWSGKVYATPQEWYEYDEKRGDM